MEGSSAVPLIHAETWIWRIIVVLKMERWLPGTGDWVTIQVNVRLVQFGDPYIAGLYI